MGIGFQYRLVDEKPIHISTTTTNGWTFHILSIMTSANSIKSMSTVFDFIVNQRIRFSLWAIFKLKPMPRFIACWIVIVCTYTHTHTHELTLAVKEFADSLSDAHQRMWKNKFVSPKFEVVWTNFSLEITFLLSMILLVREIGVRNSQEESSHINKSMLKQHECRLCVCLFVCLCVWTSYWRYDFPLMPVKVSFVNSLNHRKWSIPEERWKFTGENNPIADKFISSYSRTRSIICVT